MRQAVSIHGLGSGSAGTGGLVAESEARSSWVGGGTNPRVVQTVVALSLSAVAIGVCAAVASETGYGPLVIGVAVVIVCTLIGLLRWRLALYLLIAYLPLAGVAVVASYPKTQVAVLVKDLAFVLPAYVGFAIAAAQRRIRPSLRYIPIRAIGAFVIIVLVQFVHASLVYGPLSALIGLKVYLFYIPLCLVGYNLVEDVVGLKRFLVTMVVAGIVPTLVGLTEVAAFYSGHAATVYDLYGAAAAAATQGFFAFQFGSGFALYRVPSTFSFVTQYFYFEAAMVAISYALWRWLATHQSRWSWTALVMFVASVLASLSSGQRGAFLAIPALLSLIVLLDTSWRANVMPLGVGAAVAVAVAVVVGLNPTDLILTSGQIGANEFSNYFVGYAQQVLSGSWAGAGVGSFTNQAQRYAGITGTIYESWFVKVLAELGVLGLSSALVMLAALLAPRLRGHLALSAPYRSVSAGLLALIVWTLAYGVKGSPGDIDPLNVYFWLFLGISASVIQLARTTTPSLATNGLRPPDRALSLA